MKDPIGRRDMVPSVNGVIPRLPFFPRVVATPNFADEIPKPCGTGTYFSITNHQSYKDRPPLGRGGWNQGQLKSLRTKGHAPTPPLDKNPRALSLGRRGARKPRVKASKEVNDFVALSEKDERLEG